MKGLIVSSLRQPGDLRTIRNTVLDREDSPPSQSWDQSIFVRPYDYNVAVRKLERTIDQ